MAEDRDNDKGYVTWRDLNQLRQEVMEFCTSAILTSEQRQEQAATRRATLWTLALTAMGVSASIATVVHAFGSR